MTILTGRQNRWMAVLNYSETTKETQPLEQEVLVSFFHDDPPKHLIIRMFPTTHYTQQQEKWCYVLFSSRRATTKQPF